MKNMKKFYVSGINIDFRLDDFFRGGEIPDPGGEMQSVSAEESQRLAGSEEGVRGPADAPDPVSGDVDDVRRIHRGLK